MRWIRHHPIWSVTIAVIGVFLGLTAWVGARSVFAFDALTGEDFAPEEAAETVDTLTPDQSDEIRRDLEEEQQRARATTTVPVEDDDEAGDEWLAALDELLVAEDYGVEVHPFAFGEPVDDADHESILLVGSDASGRLADVIIDVLLPADGSTPVMVSLPRDLYLPNPCTQRWSRINTNLAGCGDFATGPELLALTVGRYTGIPVDHYAEITFDGFAGLVDALGGATVCTDVSVRDRFSDLYLEAGCSTVDGATALAWVRSRKGEALIDGVWQSAGAGDYGRQERQQELLLQIAERLSRQRNLASLAGTLERIDRFVTLDEGWTPAKAASMAWTYRSLDVEDIVRIQIPTEGYRSPTGAAVLLPTSPFEVVLAGDVEASAR